MSRFAAQFREVRRLLVGPSIGGTRRTATGQASTRRIAARPCAASTLPASRCGGPVMLAAASVEPLDGRRDQAQQRRELVAEEEQRDNAYHGHDRQDQTVLDQPLSGLSWPVDSADPSRAWATGAPIAGGRRVSHQLAGRTRTTSRPSSTSSAATPIVSERCWTSRHVFTGSASG